MGLDPMLLVPLKRNFGHTDTPRGCGHREEAMGEPRVKVAICKQRREASEKSKSANTLTLNFQFPDGEKRIWRLYFAPASRANWTGWAGQCGRKDGAAPAEYPPRFSSSSSPEGEARGGGRHSLWVGVEHNHTLQPLSSSIQGEKIKKGMLSYEDRILLHFGTECEALGLQVIRAAGG